MDWMSVLAVLIFFIGIGAGGFVVARSPTFWIGFGKEMLSKILPVLISFVLKRKSPEEEKKWREEYSRSKRDRTSD